MKHIILGFAAATALIFSPISALAADKGPRELAVVLGSPFHDQAILQREMAVPVWGWSKPGTKVSVEFAGQKKSATAGEDGKWMLQLDPLKASAEPAEMVIQEEGGNFELAAWDWFYYTEKLRQQRYQLDDNELMPYFPLDRVRDGAFEVARKLYGISFHPRDDVPLYHPDVQVFEAREADGSRIGLFMFDFYMRPSKRSGAWMSAFREQSDLDVGASRGGCYLNTLT